MTHRELASVLVGMGCPSEKSIEMAAQLDKRAHQLAARKERSYDDALAHLLRLMSQGWAAKSEARSQAPDVEDQRPRDLILPWEKLSSKPLGDFRVFSLRVDQKVSPRTKLPHDFYVLDSPTWVNVIATTPDNQLVMVEQFRHGTNTAELEIPGGIMDRTDADPVATGVRELREETGYEGRDARLLGEVFPNPAIMSNVCYTVFVQDCALKHPTQFDGGEDIITRLVPTVEIPSLIARKKIRHSLVLCALYYFDLWRRGLKAD